MAQRFASIPHIDTIFFQLNVAVSAREKETDMGWRKLMRRKIP